MSCLGALGKGATPDALTPCYTEDMVGEPLDGIGLTNTGTAGRGAPVNLVAHAGHPVGRARSPAELSRKEGRHASPEMENSGGPKTVASWPAGDVREDMGARSGQTQHRASLNEGLNSQRAQHVPTARRFTVESQFSNGEWNNLGTRRFPTELRSSDQGKSMNSQTDPNQRRLIGSTLGSYRTSPGNFAGLSCSGQAYSSTSVEPRH